MGTKEANAKMNNELKKLYEDVTADFLTEYKADFKTAPPARINEFGIIDETAYDADHGILIILRETRGWKDEDFEENKLFRDFVYGIETKKKEMNIGRSKEERINFNMWYNLGRWISAVCDPAKAAEKIACMFDDALEALGKAAITNVNKVRGETQAGSEYWKMAKSDIAIKTLKKEIEILKPRTIICGGTSYLLYLLGDEYIDSLKKDGCNVINMCHPAARISKLDMIGKVQRQMREFLSL